MNPVYISPCLVFDARLLSTYALSVNDACDGCVCLQVKHFDRQFCAKKRVKRLLDTGDRARGPINLPATRVGLQPGEH